MDFLSRVQPEGSPSRNSAPKIFADILSKCRKHSTKGSFCNTETKFLVSMQPLNSLSQRRIQGELPLRGGMGVGVTISATPKIATPLRKGSCES